MIDVDELVTPQHEAWARELRALKCAEIDTAFTGEQPDEVTPEAALERLRAAIAAHRAAMEDIGPLGIEAEFTRNQLIIIAAKRAADERLWSVIG